MKVVIVLETTEEWLEHIELTLDQFADWYEVYVPNQDIGGRDFLEMAENASFRGDKASSPSGRGDARGHSTSE